MTTPPRILFLAESGRAVGGGHVMRCLALAGALMAEGAECAFAATPDAAAVMETFAPPGVQRCDIHDGDMGDVVAQAAEAASRFDASCGVIDHYGAGPDEEILLRRAAGRLLALDDLRREHAADLVLDSNLERAADDYAGSEALLGPMFALVRPEFAKLREASLARRTQTPPVRNVLVSLGLTDPGGFTGWVAAALLPEMGDHTMEVAIGADAPSLPELRALTARYSNLKIQVETTDMAQLTAAADIAIGGGGSSVWERCVLGVPSVTVVLADNQAENTAALAAARATVALDANGGDFETRLIDGFRRLRDDQALRAAVGRSAGGLCDGQGARRVAERVLALV